MTTKRRDVCHIESNFVLLWQKKVKKPLFAPSRLRLLLIPLSSHRHKPLLPLLFSHLHAAVRHRHGVVRQRVAGHLAVVGAADGGQGAHVAGGEGISLVRPEEIRAASVTQLGRLPTGELCFTGRWE